MARTSVALVACTTCTIAVVIVISPVGTSPVATPPLAFPLALLALALGSALYSLTDSVLLALGHRRWILARSIGTGVARLGFLLVVAWAPSSTWWLLALAYSLPALIAAVATMAMFRHLLLGSAPRVFLQGSQVARFARYGLRSYAANLGGAVPANVLPPLIAWQLSPESAAEYGVAWLMASSLMLIPGAVSLTNLATVSSGEEPRESMVSRGISVVLAVQVPAVAVSLLIAPWVLSLLGNEYTDIGLGILAPLMAGVVCLSLTSQLYARARLTERGIRIVAAAQWVQAILIVISSALLLPRIGVGGASVAWLVGAGTTLVLVLGSRTPLWSDDAADQRLQ